jgi:hypothetical protein
MAYRRSRAEAVLKWGFFLLLLAGIGALLAHAAWFWFVEQERARESASWPAVDGVFERRSVPGALDSRRHAAYRYVVDGKSYQGTREGFAYKDGPLFDPGATVKVYVDPDDASSAVLYPGESDKRWPLFTGAGLSVFLALFAWAHRPWPRGQRLMTGGHKGETNWLPFIVSFLVMVGAAWILGYWVMELNRGRQAESWPAVAGTMQQPGGKKSATIYRYEVDGRSYRGARVRFAWGSKHRHGAGEAITVYVNPEDPRDAVLFPGPNWSPWIPLFVGFWLVLTAGLCWGLWPPWARSNDRPRASTLPDSATVDDP